MIDLATIGAAATAAKSATDVIKGAIEIAKGVQKKDADPETQKELLAVYTALVDAMRNVVETEALLREVRAEVVELNRFERVVDRFTLDQMPEGAVVWALKDPAPDEPMQYLCTHCYEDRIVSLLQPVNYVHHGCPRCKTKFELKPRRRSDFRVEREPGW